MGRTIRQKFKKETEDLKNIVNQLDLTNIDRTLHPATAQYTFFLSMHGTFSRIDCLLGEKRKP